MRISEIISESVAETINPAIRNKRFAHTQVIGDYTYKASVEWWEGSPLLWIKAYDGNKQIGEILFEIIVRSPGGKRDPSADYIESGGTEVDPEYRNKGVASTMYAYAKMLGNDIAPSHNQSSEGKAMWAAWKKSGEAKHLVGTAAESAVAEGSLNELSNTSLKVTEPRGMYQVNDRKQTTYKVMKFKSGKDTYLINFTVQKSPTSGKMKNWNAVNVAFGVKEKQDDYSFGDEINTDLTAKNKNQFLIYSTVINAVRKFITEYNTEIDEIIMQGAGERQEAMYQRFFQSAGKYFPGWHYNGKHSLVRDVPRQQTKKVKEQGVAEGYFDDEDNEPPYHTRILDRQTKKVIAVDGPYESENEAVDRAEAYLAWANTKNMSIVAQVYQPAHGKNYVTWQVPDGDYTIKEQGVAEGELDEARKRKAKSKAKTKRHSSSNRSPVPRFYGAWGFGGDGEGDGGGE
jgi:hypothetical protein